MSAPFRRKKAAAYDDHVFALGGNVGAVCEAVIQKSLGGGPEKVHGKVDALGVPARQLQIPGVLGAAAQHHGVEVL